jgi:hypothetical protein
VILEHYYKDKRSLARAFPEEFFPKVPEVAFAFVMTVVE